MWEQIRSKGDLLFLSKYCALSTLSESLQISAAISHNLALICKKLALVEQMTEKHYLPTAA